MSDRAFFDTNVLVYAFDRGDARRQSIASTLLQDRFKANAGALSLQVLQEFYVVSTRKIRVPLAPAVARAAIVDFLRFPVVEPSAVHLIEAIDLSIAHGLSLWDALILTTASAAGCSLLYSEDLPDGATLRGVRIENPFR